MRFCDCGADCYICQLCGRDICSEHKPPAWRKMKLKWTGHVFSGNVCPDCLESNKLWIREVEILPIQDTQKV
jgi:hypothetical protein